MKFFFDQDWRSEVSVIAVTYRNLYYIRFNSNSKVNSNIWYYRCYSQPNEYKKAYTRAMEMYRQFAAKKKEVSTVQKTINFLR